MWYLKGCERCGGDMYSSCGPDGASKECIQCGSIVYFNIVKASVKKVS